VREIVLCGINLGSYRDDGQDLAMLLAALLEKTAKPRFRLSSIEPQDASKELLTLIANNHGRICKPLPLPLQSGCDVTLQSMQRPYCAADFSRLVSDARDLMPKIAISSDVIVGFPGESDADFQCSLDFCRRAAFCRLHVFRYSRRPGTPAAAMPGQIPPTVMAARAAAMRKLADGLMANDAASRIGDVEQVLVESNTRGTSESYHRVALPAKLQPGELVSLRFDSWSANLIQASNSNGETC